MSEEISEVADATSPGPGRQIILPSEVLPPIIHLLPQEHRPFFPGQAMPLLMSAAQGLPTLQSLSQQKQDVIGLVAARDKLNTPFDPQQLYQTGTLCRIHRVHRQDDALQILLEGIQRFRIVRWVNDKGPLIASVQYFPVQTSETSDDIKAYAVAIINIIKELIPLNPLYGEELKVFLTRSNPNEPSTLADFAAALTTSSKEELQRVLETLPLLARLQMVIELLNREVQIARAQMQIRSQVDAEVQKHQREAFLRQQLKFIQQELGLTKDDRSSEIERLKQRLANKILPPTAQQRFDEELRKLSLLETGSPEFGVTRNYLDWLTGLPWGVTSTDVADLPQAEQRLNESHEGLNEAKARITEHLAVGIQRGDVAGSILLLIGPPGVGKTSLGRSVAEATGRRFYRFSLGGMRDEAEIKGHRRTYIGAMPGKLVQALTDCGTINPVILLDEIDKIGASYQGDPAAALLEVLDPEQNGEFRDHYLDLSLDLSKALFICTANQLDTIPPALLDRMEIIQLPGYLAEEKLNIAERHLIPKLLTRAGLNAKQFRLDRSALRHLIDGYAREAGVRKLEKLLATLIRKAVVQLLANKLTKVHFKTQDLTQLLGQPPFKNEKRLSGPGVVTGLAWTAMGGATLPVEATAVHDQTSGFKMTGQLGAVMKESAEIAYSFVIGNAERLGCKGFFDSRFVHLHVPAGATPKDGPSAGITIAAALLSLAKDLAPPKDWAMTGELTLTGEVFPVGGIREKLLAAKRSGIHRVLLPAANQAEYLEIPESVRAGLEVRFVSHFNEVAIALGLHDKPVDRISVGTRKTDNTRTLQAAVPRKQRARPNPSDEKRKPTTKRRSTSRPSS